MYQVQNKRYFYVGTYNVAHLERWHNVEGEVYQTRKEAQQRAIQLTDNVYYLAHSEYARPQYRVMKVS